MPPAKAHRYPASFMRMGLVEQNSYTGRYDLGGFALAMLGGGNHGAPCVRWVETGGRVTVTLRTGVVLLLTTSATGLAFSAFYHSNDLHRQLDSELLTIAKTMRTPISSLTKQLETQLNEIREHGISRASGSLIPGVNGFSAPVFDHSGNMVAAITSLGTIGHFDRLGIVNSLFP